MDDTHSLGQEPPLSALVAPVVGPARNHAASPSVALLVDLERHEGQAMFGFALRLGLSRNEAQDAVQEVLLRLWAQLGAGTSIESPRNWAYRTLYRVAMDEHRLRRRTLGLMGRVGRAVSRAGDHDQADHISVWSEVDRLPDRQRQVVYLRYQSDLSFEEIGTILGITASASRSHSTLALATLRRRLTGSEVER